jgi:hypothetical protein
VKYFLFIFHIILIFNLHAGFDGSTLVKTKSDFSPISSLKKDNSVKAYDKTNEIQEGIISFTTKKSVLKAIQISCDGDILLVSPLQQFQSFESDEWIYAFQLKPNTKIKSMINAYEIVESVNWVEGPFDLYDISVDKYHNYLVTNKELCAHNFAAIVLFGITLFTEGGVELFCSIGLAAICGAVIGFIKNICHEKSPKNPSYRYFDNRPESGPNYFEESKEDRNRKREEHRPLTNQEARKEAKKLGYKEDKNPPFDSHGKPAFRKGNDWISPDRNGHNGGVWKRCNGKGARDGTYDVKLQTKIGT